MARTALFARSRPGGVYDFESIERHPNDVWFVSSTNALAVDDSGHGRDPDAPYATLAYAATVRAANLGPQANVGDVVYLMPGHIEICTAAAPVTLSVAGITIRGLGHGANRAMIRFDVAIGADINVDAANITFENVDFVANFADVTAAVDVNACDISFIGCRFLQAGANLNAVIWIQDALAAASDRITVRDCYARDLDAANTHFINFSGTGDSHKIVNNVLLGDWGTVAVGGAGVITNALIDGNLIYNFSNSNDAIINLAATATGLVTRNYTGGTAAVANGITATACVKLENYYADLPGGDVQGILDPVIT
jgi:hypothetical protein